jgi:hypothetical protein
MKVTYQGHPDPDEDLRNVLKLSEKEKSELLKDAARKFATGKMTEEAFKTRMNAVMHFTAADHARHRREQIK